MRIQLSLLVTAAASVAAFADYNMDIAGAWNANDVFDNGLVRAQAANAYDNTATLTGGAFNGGAALQSGNTITRLLADDCTMAASFVGQTATQFHIFIWNTNTVAVTARVRFRIYGSDGAGGGPGTVLAGFTGAANSHAANTIYDYSTALGAYFVIPQATLWFGVTFDNNTGTGGTAAELNNFAFVMADPPSPGTSQDRDFLTTAAGSFFANNPAGAIRVSPFQGAIANYAVSIQATPEPGTYAAMATGLVGLLALRRRRK